MNSGLAKNNHYHIYKRSVVVPSHFEHPPLPSKLYLWSNPCILIGYTPHSKVYRLWDPTTLNMFNLFHITFTEHLNTKPSPLLSGTTLGTEHTSLPPSWESPGIIPLPGPPLNTNQSQTSHHDTNSTPETLINPLSTMIPISSLPVHQLNSTSTSISPPSITTSNGSSNPVSNANQSQGNMTNNANPSQNASTSCIPHLMIRLPPQNPPPNPPLPPTIHCSAQLQQIPPTDYTAMFIAEYTPVQETHILIPTDICLEDPLSIDNILAALSDRSLEPYIDDKDKPLWADAMASSKHEYWIASGHDELKSLHDGTMACRFSILISPQKLESPTINIGWQQPMTWQTMKLHSFLYL